jgi:Zn-dependent membrane protease YugP
MYWILFIVIAILSFSVQNNLERKFKKYSKVPTRNGSTGFEVASRMLAEYGIGNVKVTCVEGRLTDHYNPENNTVNLSKDVYYGNSIMAAAVAAHECGHAMQDAENYLPLRLRTQIVPAVNIGSTLSWPVFLLGLLFSIRPLTTAGIILFSLAVLFQLVTLPVEFDASSRALKILEQQNILPPEELKDGRKVLNAAALTYVAALAASALQLLRLVILSNNRRRD